MEERQLSIWRCWPALLCSVSQLVPVVYAAAFPTRTIGDHGTVSSSVYIKPTDAPLIANGHENDLVRRASSNSFADASVCGYFEGNKNSRHSCQNTWDCVFHSSNSAFPGMVGCCPPSAQELCSFRSTCYDKAAISATPSLRSLTTNDFVALCTQNPNAYCFTYTWPAFSIETYACSDVESSTIATMRLTGSLKGATASKIKTTESISINWTGDRPLQAIASATSPSQSSQSDKITKSTKPTATTTKGPSDRPIHRSSISAGSIGIIVGCIVGFAGIAAAVIMYWRLRRKKRRQNLANDHVNGNDTHDLIGEQENPANKPSEPVLGSHFRPAEADQDHAKPVNELEAPQSLIELETRERRHELQ